MFVNSVYSRTKQEMSQYFPFLQFRLLGRPASSLVDTPSLLGGQRGDIVVVVIYNRVDTRYSVVMVGIYTRGERRHRLTS